MQAALKSLLGPVKSRYVAPGQPVDPIEDPDATPDEVDAVIFQQCFTPPPEPVEDHPNQNQNPTQNQTQNPIDPTDPESLPPPCQKSSKDIVEDAIIELLSRLEYQLENMDQSRMLLSSAYATVMQSIGNYPVMVRNIMHVALDFSSDIDDWLLFAERQFHCLREYLQEFREYENVASIRELHAEAKRSSHYHSLAPEWSQVMHALEEHYPSKLSPDMADA